MEMVKDLVGDAGMSREDMESLMSQLDESNDGEVPNYCVPNCNCCACVLWLCVVVVS